MASFTAPIENVLLTDDLNRSQVLGDSERQVGQTVLVLVATPAILVPLFFQHFKKKTHFGILVLAALFISIFYILQYRLGWILALSERLKIHERIRI